MIVSFADADTADLFTGRKHKSFIDMVTVALRKLDQLEAAVTLGDLRVSPGNCLEPLRGDLAGKHSIRGNDQYRITFVWTADGPAEVQIMDYH